VPQPAGPSRAGTGSGLGVLVEAGGSKKREKRAMTGGQADKGAKHGQKSKYRNDARGRRRVMKNRSHSDEGAWHTDRRVAVTRTSFMFQKCLKSA